MFVASTCKKILNLNTIRIEFNDFYLISFHNSLLMYENATLGNVMYLGIIYNIFEFGLVLV